MIQARHQARPAMLASICHGALRTYKSWQLATQHFAVILYGRCLPEVLLLYLERKFNLTRLLQWQCDISRKRISCACHHASCGAMHVCHALPSSSQVYTLM